MNEFLHNLRSNKDRRYGKNRKPHDNQYGGNTYSQGGHYQDRRRKQQVGNNYSQEQNVAHEESNIDMALLSDNIVNTLKSIAQAQEKRADAENRKAEALESISVYLMKLAGVDLSEHIKKVVEPVPVQKPVPAQASVQTEKVAETKVEKPEATEKVGIPKKQIKKPVKPVKSVKPVQAEPVIKKEKKAPPVRKAVPTKPAEKTKQAKTKTTEVIDIVSERAVVMKIIVEMRKEGATYNMIAERLISDDIPTFSRKGQWHAQTIHRLCQSKKKK